MYGTVASLQFPLDLKSFNFFYQDERFPLAVGVVPRLGRRPSAPHTAPTLSETLVKVGGGQAKWLGLPGRRIHDAYRLYHSPPYPADAASATLWLYGHAATSSTQPTNFSSPTTEPGVLPESGFPSFSRVEVMHCAEAANAVSWQLPLTLYHAALETCMKPDPTLYTVLSFLLCAGSTRLLAVSGKGERPLLRPREDHRLSQPM